MINRNRSSHYRVTNMMLQSLFDVKGTIIHVEMDHSTGIISLYTDDGDKDLVEGEIIPAHSCNYRLGWAFKNPEDK